MALASTITVNIGSPAADVVFTKSGYPTADSVAYTAPSPNSDLAGKPTLAVKHEKTNSGLVKSLVQLRFPQESSSAPGTYPTYVQVNMTVSRPRALSLTEVDRVLEAAQEIWATSGFRAAVANEEV